MSPPRRPRTPTGARPATKPAAPASRASRVPAPATTAGKKTAAPPAKPARNGRPAPKPAATPVPPVAAKSNGKPAPVPAAKVEAKSNGKAAPAAKPKPAAPPVSPAPAAKAPAAPRVPLRPRVPPLSVPIPAAKAPSPAKPPMRATNLRVEAAIPSEKDLSARPKSGTPVTKDRILLTAPDPYWLHAMWELSLQSVQRAEAALGQDWHGAKPILRLCDVTSTETTNTSELVVRDIIIHGGCSHWYIDVPQPPRAYRVDIGYLPRRGNFFRLGHSNIITPPKAGSSEVLDDAPHERDPNAPHRATMENGPVFGRELDDAMFRRPMKENAFGSGASLPGKLKKFFFDLDAELIVYGKTDPNATVTLSNEVVPLRADGSGTFTMRFSLPDSRQIIPAVATSADGMEEQTIVLAVERNTKRLDVVQHDLTGEN